MLEEMNKMNEENDALRAEKRELLGRMKLTEAGAKGGSSRSSARSHALIMLITFPASFARFGFSIDTPRSCLIVAHTSRGFAE